MGIVTTGIISFVLVTVTVGLSAEFFATWLRGWTFAYIVVVPIILVIGPRLQTQIERWVR
jgi:hypothetical protein